MGIARTSDFCLILSTMSMALTFDVLISSLSPLSAKREASRSKSAGVRTQRRRGPLCGVMRCHL